MKYIEIHERESKNKKMKDTTYVENVEICCNMYKYWNRAKYIENDEIDQHIQQC